jgi:hypothetical protein
MSKETHLHAALKSWYAQTGDRIEAEVDGYIIDIVHDNVLIEIQTRHFHNIRVKLNTLLPNHFVHLVFPIAQEKWILRHSGDNKIKDSRRKSPKHGRVEYIFDELIRIPDLITHPNFTIEILMTNEEELWVNDGKGSWRRKGWSIQDRRLLKVVDRITLTTPADLRSMLPHSLPQPFTTGDLAKSIQIRRSLAQKMAFCLRQSEVITISGKQGQSYLYLINDEPGERIQT